MPKEEGEISRFYTVLGHPLRRSMIKIIGETGSASFTDLLPLRIIAPVVVVATVAAIAYYLTKRKTMTPQGSFSLP